MMKACLNWKALAALGMLGLGVWVLAPGLAGAALPFLLMAACPLSMLLMGRSMGNRGVDAQRSANAPLVEGYTCQMHPEILRRELGSCPRCGMDLVPAPPVGEMVAAEREPLTREVRLAELRAQLKALDEDQAAVSRKIGELVGEGDPVGNKAVREAEQIARAADQRP